MIPRALGYPLALLALLAGVVPAASCVDSRRGAPYKTEALKRHTKLDASGPAEGPVVLTGKASGEPRRSATGRSCLAFRYSVSRRSGKNTTYVCSGRSEPPVEVVTPDGARFSVPLSGMRLDLALHSLSEKRPPEPPVRCAGYQSGDSLAEWCLQPDDPVQVWACRQPGSDKLVPCRDEGDVIEAPPSPGPLVKLQQKTQGEFSMAVLWLSVWAGVALTIVSRRVFALTRREPPSQENP